VGDSGGGPGRPPCWRTLQASCKGLGSGEHRQGGGFLVYSFFPVVCVFLVKFVKLIKIVVH